MFINYHTYLRTCFIQQIPSSEANRFSDRQEILRSLWKPKVHYHVYYSPPPIPILSQITPIHAPSSHFLKIHLIIILPSTPGSSKWSLSFRFPHQNPIYTSSLLPHTCYMTNPSHSSWFYDTNNIWWRIQVFFTSLLYSFFHSPVVSSLLCH